MMTRTWRRPIPHGRIARGEAFAFGIVLASFSVGVLGLLVSWFAAALLAFTIFFYVVIYTVWLKRSTPQNIVIGGAAGALPPIIGWTAASGSLAIEPILLFLIIFFWTPPHFWALSLYRREDYARAGIPMLPVTHGEPETRRQIFIYTLVLVASTLAVLPFTRLGMIYGASAGILGAIFIAGAVRLLREPTT